MANLNKKTKHIVDVYVQYFGRVATEDEIRSFDDVKTLSKITTEVRVNAAKESGLKGSDYLNSIIQNLFGRDANPKELKYVKTIENNKNLPIATIIKNGSRDDKAVYNTKKLVAQMVAAEGGSYELDNITQENYKSIYNVKTGLTVKTIAELEAKIVNVEGNINGKTFPLTASATGDTHIGTEKSDLFNATTLNSLQNKDVLLDSTTTDSDILNAAVTTDSVNARIQNIETINVTGEYVKTGLDLTNVSGAKTLNLDTKLAGGTASVIAANSINAAAIKAGANISTLNVTSLTSGTRDTVTVDGGNANVGLIGQAAGADKYSVTIAKDKTLTATTMNTAGDELTVNAANNFKLNSATATNVELVVNIANTGTAAIAVDLVQATTQNAKTVNLSGNEVVLKDATGLSLKGAVVNSTATKSTVEITGTAAATTDLSKAEVSEVLISGAGATSITVNENSKLVLARDQGSTGLTANIENAAGDMFTSTPKKTGTLLLDVNTTQTASVGTGANVDTVLLTAGKLADKDGKAQTVTIAEFKTDAKTDTIVVNGANDLVITKLSGNGDEVISATAHTGKLTINDFTANTKVFSGSNNDTFVSKTAAAVLEISSGAGNDTVDLSVSTAANKINLGAGDDTVTTGSGGDTITLGAGKDTVIIGSTKAGATIADAVIGEDKIILTGAATAGTAVNVAALGTITAGSYATAFGANHAFILTGSTASDLSGLVQFGKQAVAATATTAAVAEVAYTAAANLALTTGSFNDVVSVGASSGNINLGAGDDKIIVTGAQTGKITGGAGSDTFAIGANATIADLGATDILQVTAGTVSVDVVESFTATAATTNANNATTLNLKDGVNVDMTLATLTAATNGYTITTDTAVTKGATIVGSRGDDIITGSKFADTITGGEGIDTITAGAGADTIILTESVSAADTVKFLAVSDSAASVAANTTVTFDKIVDFNAGANNAAIDLISITGANFVAGATGMKAGAVAILTTGTGATNLANTTINDFAGLAALTNATNMAKSATGANGINAYIIDLAGNTGALGTGKYLVINDGVDGLQATDLMVEITGFQGTFDATDFVVA